jgi:hypothetical protein
VATGLPHPGVVSLPLRDGPQVATRLLWDADDHGPVVASLVELAIAWTGDRRAHPARL